MITKNELGGYRVIRSADATLHDSNRVSSLKIPPTVKNFMWRSLTGCLPTKENYLLCKRVAVLSVCPVFIPLLHVSLQGCVGIMLG